MVVLGPTKLRQKLQALSGKGYENNAVTIAAKLLQRDKKRL